MEKLSDEEQRKRVSNFYRELWTYTGQIPGFVPVLLGIPCVVLFCIPISLMEEHLMILLGMCLMANLPMAVLFPYLDTRYAQQPKTQNQEIYRVLQYLPVSRKQIRSLLMEKLFKYFWKFGLAAVLGQIFFSCMTDTFRISSILLTVLVTLILPVGIGILTIYRCTKEKKSPSRWMR